MSTKINIDTATTDVYIGHMPNKKILTTGSDTIRNKILNCLMTERGSRAWEPTWGADITRYAFEPCDATTAYDIETTILEALNTFFRDDITVGGQGVRVFPDPDNQQMIIYITFSNKRTGSVTSINFILKKPGEA